MHLSIVTPSVSRYILYIYSNLCITVFALKAENCLLRGGRGRRSGLLTRQVLGRTNHPPSRISSFKISFLSSSFSRSSSSQNRYTFTQEQLFKEQQQLELVYIYVGAAFQGAATVKTGKHLRRSNISRSSNSQNYYIFMQEQLFKEQQQLKQVYIRVRAAFLFVANFYVVSKISLKQ